MEHLIFTIDIRHVCKTRRVHPLPLPLPLYDVVTLTVSMSLITSIPFKYLYWFILQALQSYVRLEQLILDACVSDNEVYW